VVDGEEVASLEVVEDRLVGVRLGDGRVVEREALAVWPRMRARAEFLAGLGVRAVEDPAGLAEHIASDATGRTDVPGVWVAGNATDLAAPVGAAAAAGAWSAAQINADHLVAEDTERAVGGHRARREAQTAGVLFPYLDAL
jgi:thioredoxin reductase